VPAHGAAVLVTGASSGIGRDACLGLSALGGDSPRLTVFCGVRSERDRAALVEASGGRVHALLLDVTSEADIASTG